MVRKQMKSPLLILFLNKMEDIIQLGLQPIQINGVDHGQLKRQGIL